MKRLATATVAAVMAAAPVMADLVFPSLSYRTGAYAAGGIPFADGYADYMTLLNERDGGIGGVMTRILECETGYNTEKGVECYEATKGEGALVYQPLSTGITYQLIPKATADGIAIHSMGYGRTSAANGKVFRKVFNYPANYWNGASAVVQHILDVNGGDIKGKKIAVPDAEVATHSIIVAKSSKGVDLRLVCHDSKNLSINHMDTIDESRGHSSINLDNVDSILIGEEGNGWECYQTLLDQAAVLFSFEQIGGAQASLDMALSYAKEIYAFGRQIGSFQAIKHKVADMYVSITLAKSNSYYAAWALSTESSDLAVASATARVSATKAFQFCSKENIQTHGGNGFTWEYDCHLFYRRSKLLSVNLGSLSNWKNRLVTGLEKSNTN